MLVTDNVSGTCRSRMAVSFISCPVFIIDICDQAGALT